jgi:hypothetical protein
MLTSIRGKHRALSPSLRNIARKCTADQGSASTVKFLSFALFLRPVTIFSLAFLNFIVRLLLLSSSGNSPRASYPIYLPSSHFVDLIRKRRHKSPKKKMLDQPGVFTYRDGVAVIQLVAFTIYLAFSFVLCWRHGFRRSEGWVILVTFSILRMLAACFQLATINHPTRSIYGGALICQGIGLAPLTLLNIGLFGRV